MNDLQNQTSGSITIVSTARMSRNTGAARSQFLAPLWLVTETDFLSNLNIIFSLSLVLPPDLEEIVSNSLFELAEGQAAPWVLSSKGVWAEGANAGLGFCPPGCISLHVHPSLFCLCCDALALGIWNRLGKCGFFSSDGLGKPHCRVVTSCTRPVSFSPRPSSGPPCSINII